MSSYIPTGLYPHGNSKIEEPKLKYAIKVKTNNGVFFFRGIDGKTDKIILTDKRKAALYGDRAAHNMCEFLRERYAKQFISVFKSLMLK